MQNFPDNDFDGWIKNAIGEPNLGYDPEAWNLMEKKLDSPILPWWSILIHNISILTGGLIVLYLMLFNIDYGFSDHKTLLNDADFENITASMEKIIPFSVDHEKEDISYDHTSNILKREKKEVIGEDMVRVESSEPYVNLSGAIHPDVTGREDLPPNEYMGEATKEEKDLHMILQEGANKVEMKAHDNFSAGLKANKKALDHPIVQNEDKEGYIVPSVNKNQDVGNSDPGDRNLSITSQVGPKYDLPYVDKKPYAMELTPFTPFEWNTSKAIDIQGEHEEIIIPGKNRAQTPKWNINVLVSPDVSSINFANVKGTGLNMGIGVEYYLSTRWRVSTGLIRSSKVYGVVEENIYRYGYGPPPSQAILEGIDAKCYVLDIPLNIRYNITATEKGNLFVSTGLSTYLMLQEDYEYKYTHNSNKYSNVIQIKGENQHFFQIMNLSLGYEKDLGRRFSIQGEPFLKIPFKDVGYGKVRLLSAGAFFSVKYKLY